MASAARCVPALARTTLALDARARTRPARWFPKREARGFFYRRCRGRRWIPGRDVACRSDPARRGNGDRTSEVVRRDARRERAAGASSPTRASPARKPSGSDAPNISIAPTPRLPCAKCHARPRRRDARRAERARSRRRGVSPASGRRGALEGARGRTRRPARGGRRSDGTNNRTRLRQRQFVCRARPHERTARAVLLFGDWLLQRLSCFARLCGRRPLVADPLLSPRHRSPRTSFRTLRPVATAL